MTRASVQQPSRQIPRSFRRRTSEKTPIPKRTGRGKQDGQGVWNPFAGGPYLPRLPLLLRCRPASPGVNSTPGPRGPEPAVSQRLFRRHRGSSLPPLRSRNESSPRHRWRTCRVPDSPWTFPISNPGLRPPRSANHEAYSAYSGSHQVKPVVRAFVLPRRDDYTPSACGSGVKAEALAYEPSTRQAISSRIRSIQASPHFQDLAISRHEQLLLDHDVLKQELKKYR